MKFNPHRKIFLTIKFKIMKRNNNGHFNPDSFVRMTRAEVRNLTVYESVQANLSKVLYLKGWQPSNASRQELHSKLEIALIESEN